jgi:dTMP kinase
MSLFITFEGGEGSGKSVQAKALYRRLSRLAIPAILTHEPGVTSLGRKIARWLKWGKDMGISPMTELMLFNASRAQLVNEVIGQGLQSGKVVICDRYADSTTAYQSYGRGLDLEMVRAVNTAAVHGIWPDITVLLDIPVEAGLARKKDMKQDRFEQEDIVFHRRVRQGYLELARAEPDRWLVIDAGKSREEIAAIIWQKVRQLLSLKPQGSRGVKEGRSPSS